MMLFSPENSRSTVFLLGQWFIDQLFANSSISRSLFSRSLSSGASSRSAVTSGSAVSPRSAVTSRSAGTASALVIAVLLIAVFSFEAKAQPAAADQLELFREDRPEFIAQQDQARQKVLKNYQKNESQELKVRGDSVSFSKSGETLILKNRVVASSGSFSIQADAAEVNTERQQGVFDGRVFLSNPEFSVGCSKAYIDVPYELGVFSDASLRMDQVEFNSYAKSIIKYSEDQYRMYNSSLSTCDTDLNPLPWEIFSDTLDITQDGYANAYWAGLSFYGVPIAYSPYLGFPVKQDRSSGLLAPVLGVNQQNGLQVYLPAHLVFDDATDMTLTPFIETETRMGGELEVRKAFSLRHNLKSRWLYSDESARGSDLQGLLPNLDGSLPFDSTRFGGFHNHRWQSSEESPVSMSALADIHYVSDDSILRELEDAELGFRNAPFLSSRAVVRTAVGAYGSFDLSSEFNQSIDGNIQANDDTLLQRLPEANLMLSDSWRPFGYNKYGVKLLPTLNLNSTSFSRKVGVDGMRSTINPGAQIPFHYQNFLAGALSANYYSTAYQLNSTEGALDSLGRPQEDSPTRQTYVLGANVSTALERVYDIEEGGLISTLAGLGVDNYEMELKRVKHQVEPFMRYMYAPDVDQENLPLFDLFDRIRSRSVVTYGVTSRLLGKRESIRAFRSTIEELTPEVEDLPELGFMDSLVNLDFPRDSLPNAVVAPRSGVVSDFASFSILQSYDLVEAGEDLDPLREPFSDVNVNFALSPNSIFGVQLGANYSPERGELSSWTTALSARDDRGDSVMLRYNLVSPLALVDGVVVDGQEVSNIETQLEFVLTDRVKFGYYARYDGALSEFIDQIYGLRFANGCNCWAVDVGFSDRINPDRQQLLMKFNLMGIGRLQQGVLYNSLREGVRNLQ